MKGDPILDFVYDLLSRELKSTKKDLRTFKARSERAETTGGFVPKTMAEALILATDAQPGDVLFITDGRKDGQGVGDGTGCPAYFNAATGEWFKFSEDTAVLV